MLSANNIHIETTFCVECVQVNGIFIFLVTTSMIPASLLFLPYLKRKCISEVRMIVIGLIIKSVSMLLLASVSYEDTPFHRQYAVLYVAAFTYGASFFLWAVVDAMITKCVPPTEQGMAFGINNAYREVSKIIGQFSFGAFYVFSTEQWDMPYLFMLVGVVLCVLSMLIAIVPLQRSILQAADNETRQREQEAVPAETPTATQLELSLAGDGEEK